MDTHLPKISKFPEAANIVCMWRISGKNANQSFHSNNPFFGGANRCFNNFWYTMINAGLTGACHLQNLLRELCQKCRLVFFFLRVHSIAIISAGLNK
jgi:hypothetical protein